MELILILGLSASGKTIRALTYSNTHKVIHSDDFITKYTDASCYFINKVIRQVNGNVVMEGVAGFTYLLDMHEYNFVKPKLILYCQSTKEDRVIRLVERCTYTDKSFSMDKVYLGMWEKFKHSGNKIPWQVITN